MTSLHRLAITHTYHTPAQKNEWHMHGISGAGTTNLFGAPELTPFQSSSCCSIFSFLCSVLQISVRPFVFAQIRHHTCYYFKLRT